MFVFLLQKKLQQPKTISHINSLPGVSELFLNYIPFQRNSQRRPEPFFTELWPLTPLRTGHFYNQDWAQVAAWPSPLPSPLSTPVRQGFLVKCFCELSVTTMLHVLGYVDMQCMKRFPGTHVRHSKEHITSPSIKLSLLDYKSYSLWRAALLWWWGINQTNWGGGLREMKEVSQLSLLMLEGSIGLRYSRGRRQS